MKRVLCLALAVAAAAFLGMSSSKQKDIGDLLPVQTLVVTRENGQFRLNGGEKLSGSGQTWELAMQDLIDGAPGEAFFGSTGHVVFDRAAAGALADAMSDERLRPAARLYFGSGEIKPDEASEFLNAHPGGRTIQQLTADVLAGKPARLALLVGGEGGYRLSDG